MIKNDEPDWSRCNELSEHTTALLKGLLCKDKESRFNIVQALEHEAFKDIGEQVMYDTEEIKGMNTRILK